MSVLVNQQDEIINNIDVQAAKVEDDTRQGYARLILSFRYIGSHMRSWLVWTRQRKP
jgi:hypothetical protein